MFSSYRREPYTLFSTSRPNRPAPPPRTTPCCPTSRTRPTAAPTRPSRGSTPRYRRPTLPSSFYSRRCGHRTSVRSSHRCGAGVGMYIYVCICIYIYIRYRRPTRPAYFFLRRCGRKMCARSSHKCDAPAL